MRTPELIAQVLATDGLELHSNYATCKLKKFKQVIK